MAGIFTFVFLYTIEMKQERKEKVEENSEKKKEITEDPTLKKLEMLYKKGLISKTSYEKALKKLLTKINTEVSNLEKALIN